jgi:hypothetical protein
MSSFHRFPLPLKMYAIRGSAQRACTHSFVCAENAGGSDGADSDVRQVFALSETEWTLPQAGATQAALPPSDLGLRAGRVPAGDSQRARRHGCGPCGCPRLSL